MDGHSDSGLIELASVEVMTLYTGAHISKSI